jgi:hypothetical protein
MNQVTNGCRLFQVQLPRKALEIIKQRYGNTGALIRGLLAEELGPDWPADELQIVGPVDQHRLKLKVTKPRTCQRILQPEDQIE